MVTPTRGRFFRFARLERNKFQHSVWFTRIKEYCSLSTQHHWMAASFLFIFPFFFFFESSLLKVEFPCPNLLRCIFRIVSVKNQNSLELFYDIEIPSKSWDIPFKKFYNLFTKVRILSFRGEFERRWQVFIYIPSMMMFSMYSIRMHMRVICNKNWSHIRETKNKRYFTII